MAEPDPDDSQAPGTDREEALARIGRRRFFGNAALFAGGAALGSVAAQAMQSDSSSARPRPSPIEPLTARGLGARGDGTGDDGAILSAAIAELVGTLASQQSSVPITIYFGDGRSVYNLASPIRVQQNHVRLVGDGAILQCQGPSAVIGDHAGSANILFGIVVRGFTLKGRASDDAIVIRSGSQCEVSDIRNFAAVDGALVALEGTISSQTHGIKSDGTFGASCRNVIREAPYQKTLGRHFNCIANRHEDFLGYGCLGAGVLLVESDAFRLSGDVENCQGPGVDLLNSRFGTVTVYTEVNGQGASLRGSDTPDDIRIRSGGGKLIDRAANILVTQTACGGAQVKGTAPNNVHIDSADDCVVQDNFLGGNIRLGAGARRTVLGRQARFIGQVIDQGEGTLLQGLVAPAG